MASATCMCDELDIHAFQAGIFMWGANLIAPVNVFPGSDP